MRRHRYIFLPVCLSVALAVSAGSSPARMSAQAGSAEAAQAPGYSFAVDGRKVIVGAARGGQSYEFTVRPAGAAHFKDEATPKKPGAGAPAEIILQGCAASSTEPTLLEGIVVDGSLSVTNPQGKRFQAGADFTVERGGTAIAIQPAGAAASEPRLIAEYSCWLTRMDSIVVDKTGAVKLVEGTESKSAPDLPAMAEDETAIANILVRGDRQTITPDDVLEVRSEPVAPTCRDSLRQYVDRLKAGGTVKFGFLGDSVTGGSSASSPLLSFPRSFHTTMQEKFPGARVQSAVFAIPGAKSYDLLPMIGKFLNDERPDLLFVEFVNDLGVSPQRLQSSYAQLLSVCEQAHVKPLLIAPHFPAPQMAKASSWAGIQDKFYLTLLHELARDRQIELVDVSQRWAHLDRDGLRPDLMLVNRLNHPNDTGHAIYRQELLRCFGIEVPLRPVRQAATNR